MKRVAIVLLSLLTVAVQITGCSPSSPASRRTQAEIRQLEARDALHNLYDTTPGAAALARDARAILVFPDVTKAGFIIGGQYGTGVLFKDDRVAGYYTSVAASYGLQAGAQKFGYALFFMNDGDLAYLDRSEGWEVGVGPTITVVDEGFARSFTTTTARKGVYAFFFEQRGLMAGLGIQGTKISKTDTP